MGTKYLKSLFKKSATGAIQKWDIGVKGTTIITSFGQVGGQFQTTSDTIKSGKSAGKKNATTAEEQALKEATSRWEKKKKSGYVESLKGAQAGETDSLILGGVVPMLAKSYDDHAAKVSGMVAVQPKLDGMRCLCMIDGKGSVTLWSRTRKPIKSVNHIIYAMETIAEVNGYKSMCFDGELYNHDLKDDFEKLMSAARKDTTTIDSLRVQYHIYDVVLGAAPFQDRADILHLMENGLNCIRIVDTAFTTGEEAIARLHDQYVKAGYEGAMVRLLDRGYEHKRSDQLLKLKGFKDEEFEIIGAEEGRGKLAGHCGAFVCITPDGKEVFSVKMSGETAKLKDYWNNRNDYIGSKLTVKYQSKTGRGVPRFPVGLRIRESLDL